MHSRQPAVAQIGVAVEREFLAALLLDHAVADIDAAIFHRIEVETEIGAGPHFAAKFQRMRRAPQREVLDAIERVVAAADGPIVCQPEHLAVDGAVPDVGSEETALARQRLQRFVIGREIKDRHLLDPKHSVVSDGAVAGRMSNLAAVSRHHGFGTLQSVTNPSWMMYFPSTRSPHLPSK